MRKTRELTFRLISTSLILIFAFSLIVPKDAFAYRSRDGGGDVPQFSFGDFATTAGMSIGMFVVGQAFSVALGSAWSYLSTGSELGSTATNLTDSTNNLLNYTLEKASEGLATGEDIWNATYVAQYAPGLVSAPPEVVHQFTQSFYALQNSASTAISGSGTFGSVANNFTALSSLSGSLSNMGGNVFSAMGNGLTKSFNSWDKVGMNFVSGYNTFVATSLTGKAIGTMGYYYNWSKPLTFIVSNVASAAVGGFLNPSISLGDTIAKGTGKSLAEYNLSAGITDMLRGGAVGGLTGLAKSLAMVAVDRQAIDQGRNPGAMGQIAGLVAGVAAGNLFRALVNPDTWTRGTEKIIQKNEEYDKYLGRLAKYNELINLQDAHYNASQEYDARAASYLLDAENAPDSEWRDYYLKLAGDNSNKAWANYNNSEYYREQSLLSYEGVKDRPSQYVEVKGWSPTKGLQGIDKDSLVPINDQKVVDLINKDPRYYPANPSEVLKAGYGFLDKNTLVVTSDEPLGFSDYAGRLFNAAVIKTADAWPRIGAQSLGIVAREAFRDKKNDLLTDGRNRFNALSVLAGTVAENVGAAVFSGLAQNYALIPSLYFGEKSTINAALYYDSMKKTAYQLAVNNSVGRVKIDYGTDGRGGSNDLKTFLTAAAPNLANMSTEDLKSRLEESMNSTNMSEKDRQDYRYRMDAGNITGGMAIFLAQTEQKFKLSGNESVADTYDKLGISQLSSFGSNLSKGLMFSLLEGASSGAARFLISKIDSHHDNPLSAAAEIYAASMGAALMRGIVWSYTWEPQVNNRWATDNRIDMRAEAEKMSDDPFKQAAANYNSAINYARFDRFLTETGLGYAEKSQPYFEDGQKKYRDMYMAKLEFYGQENGRPTLADFVTTSLEQANFEFANKALAFGAPVTRSPEGVDTFQLNDYISAVNGFAMSGSRSDWFKHGVVGSIENAAASVITNEVMNSVASSKSLANILDLQQVRLVYTNAPNMPFALQMSDARPWAGGFQTNYYGLPNSLNPTVMSQSSRKSYLRENR